MPSKFISNLSFLVLLNLLIKPIWILGIDRSVQNAVGAEEYGFYYALFNFVFLFQMALDWGINNWNNRSVARDSEHLRERFSKLFTFKILLIALFALLVFVCGKMLGFSQEQFSLLFWLGLNQVLLSFILFIRSNISGLQHFKWDAIISVMDRSFMILICAVLLWGGITDEAFKIEWFVYAQSIAYGLVFLSALAILFIKEPKIRIGFSMDEVSKVIRQSYPYALLGVLMMAYYRVDSVMLERMLPNGNFEAGKYASAYRLLDAVVMLAFLFSTILLPLFSKMIKENRKVQGILSLSLRTLGVMSLSVASISWLFKDEIMDLLYVQATSEWGDIYAWLMLSLPLICWIYTLGTLLTANGNLRVLNVISLLALVVNIVLNYFLIPDYGALGATWATLATQFVVLLGHQIEVQRRFPLPELWRTIALLFAFALIIIISGWGLQQTGLSWRLSLLSLAALSGLAAFALGLFKWQSLKALVSERG